MDYLNTNVAFIQVQPVTKTEDVVRFILSGPLVGLDNVLLWPD